MDSIIVEKLDAIANRLELKGLIKEAYDLDIVSNTISTMKAPQKALPGQQAPQESPPLSKMSPDQAARFLQQALQQAKNDPMIMKEVATLLSQSGTNVKTAAMSGLAKAIFLAILTLAPAALSQTGGKAQLANLAMNNNLTVENVIKVDKKVSKSEQDWVNKRVEDFRKDIDRTLLDVPQNLAGTPDSSTIQLQVPNKDPNLRSGEMVSLEAKNYMGKLVLKFINQEADRAQQALNKGALSYEGVQYLNGKLVEMFNNQYKNLLLDF